ncbi:hypothetical protein MRB53_009986 [Persea americana]|uniref:Uncharacterized protein n=1 Tax=Persea americana TaxID=3435 RepID=A0ACC2LQL1_PERAE|nr:hypothetical protein MRB53_009986 [Persea americana]
MSGNNRVVLCHSCHEMNDQWPTTQNNDKWVEELKLTSISNPSIAGFFFLSCSSLIHTLLNNVDKKREPLQLWFQV